MKKLRININFVKLIIAIFMVSYVFISNTEAQIHKTYRYVALAIAAPGPGVSMFGHAFLLFFNDESKMSESMAVQFNLKRSDNQKIESPIGRLIEQVSSVLGKNIPFRVEIIPGLEMIDIYRAEQRPVMIYFLDFSQEQINALVSLLNSEYQKRLSGELIDYSVTNNNCLTTILYLLNQIIPNPEQKFPYLSGAAEIEEFLVNLFGATPLYVQNSPFYFVLQLENNPLISKVMVFNPNLVIQAKLLVSLDEHLNSLGKICDSSVLIEFGTNLAGKPKLRESKTFLDVLQKTAFDCSNSSAIDHYHDAVRIIFRLASTIKARIFIAKYLDIHKELNVESLL